MNRTVVFLWVALAVCGTCRPAWSALVLSVAYTGPAEYQGAFTNASSTWESFLTGYQDGVVVGRSSGSSYKLGDQVSELFIEASVVPIDGVGSILGRAGPTETVDDASGFVLATDGIMQFDSADVAVLFSSGRLEAVILHEMAHVMGFGTLWEDNGVYVSGSGEYTGPNATLSWQTDFDQIGTPDVELGGGGGTANGHWNEVNGGGGLTGITDSLGRDMRDELMTGWLNPNSFISDMTIRSFVDIGFTAVPEPTALGLVGLAGVACSLLRRRR